MLCQKPVFRERKGERGVMSDEQFRREKSYLVCLNILKSLVGKGLMTDEEYALSREILVARFKPLTGAMFG